MQATGGGGAPLEKQFSGMDVQDSNTAGDAPKKPVRYVPPHMRSRPEGVRPPSFGRGASTLPPAFSSSRNRDGGGGGD